MEGSDNPAQVFSTVNSEIFVRILFSRIIGKRHICHIENSD